MRKTILRLREILAVVLLTAGIVACSGNAPELIVTNTPITTIEDTAVLPTSLPVTCTSEPEAATEPVSEQPVIEQITVTYVTPSQTEGPYYPVDKPEDRDNDLTVVPGASGAPAGQILEFSGRLYDAAGTPVENAIIEIW